MQWGSVGPGDRRWCLGQAGWCWSFGTVLETGMVLEFGIVLELGVMLEAGAGTDRDGVGAWGGAGAGDDDENWDG